MDMYKEASQLGLRFLTSVGELSTEKLWGLSRPQLRNAIKAAKKLLNQDDDDELAFLEDKEEVDNHNQLRFNILKDVFMTKKEEDKKRINTASDKEHNAKIDAIIAEKKEGSLRELSIEDLEKLRK